jgi:hypothetical protein
MAKFTLTATPQQIVDTTGNPLSFYIHADSGNTSNIRLSDNSTMTEYEELAGGQSIDYEDFEGVLYVAAASGSPILHILWAAKSRGLIQRA